MRYKIPQSSYFFIDEIVHPDIYEKFGKESLKFINPKLLELISAIRTLINEPIVINNYEAGGKFINSGLRCYKNPLGDKVNYSRHYFGLCADLKFKSKTIKEVFSIIKENESWLMINGLTVVENIDHTPTWLHIGVEYTGLDKLKIINP